MKPVKFDYNYEIILSPLNEMQLTGCQRTVSLAYGLYRPSNRVTPHSG